MKQYIVKKYSDSLDPNPIVSMPMPEWEALDVKADWVSETMDYIVQHSPYSISEEEYEEIYENELALVVIEEA